MFFRQRISTTTSLLKFPMKQINVIKFPNAALLPFNRSISAKRFASAIPKVKNEKLLKAMLKSKIITRMYNNPKYDRFFKELLEANTSTIVVTFFVLHEVTAIVPLFVLWYLAYENWDSVDRYYESLMEEFSVKKEEVNENGLLNQSDGKNLDLKATKDETSIKHYFFQKCHEKMVHFHKVFAKMSRKYFLQKRSQNDTAEMSTEEINADIEKLRRLTLSGASSYLIVKAIAPLRIMFSIYYTPKLSRILQQTLFNSLRNVFKKA